MSQGFSNEQKRDDAVSSEGDLAVLLDSLKPHIDSLGLVDNPRNFALEDEVLLYEMQHERRKLYLMDGILLEMKKADNGIYVTSYCTGSKGELKFIRSTLFDDREQFVNRRKANDFFNTIKLLIGVYYHKSYGSLISSMIDEENSEENAPAKTHPLSYIAPHIGSDGVFLLHPSSLFQFDPANRDSMYRKESPLREGDPELTSHWTAIMHAKNKYQIKTRKDFSS